MARRLRRTQVLPGGALRWLGAVLALYLAVPLVAFAVRFARTPGRGFGVPGLVPALWVSLVGATISAALIALFGIPLAYVLARAHGRAAQAVSALVRVPLAIPPVMSGILLIYIVGPYTFLGQLSGERLTESMYGVVIAMTFCSAPFLVVAAQAGFSAIDGGLLDVAAALGHGEVSRFVRVALPTAGASVRAGLVLSWLRAFGEYGAVVVLAYNPASLPVYTYKQFGSVGLPTTLAPTAIAMAVAIGVVALSRITRLPTRRADRELAPPAPPARASSLPVSFSVRHSLGGFDLAALHEPSSAHLAILGPSGSGKSTLLRCIAGLSGGPPGIVAFGDERVDAQPAERRRVGYVAQGFSLFPTMTVRQHLAFPRAATRGASAHWADRLGLVGLLDRRPHELSGGQRQRVGLAQVLCSEPRVLLLDEPFTALDAPVRMELRRELRRLQRETGLATVLVTHDPEEAAFLADDVVVLADGDVLQDGTVKEVFTRPSSLAVARLVGLRNVHAGTVSPDGVLAADGVSLLLGPHAPTGAVLWAVPPDAAGIGPLGDGPSALRHSDEVAGTVVDVVDLGTSVLHFVHIGKSAELDVRTPFEVGLVAGQPCRVRLPAEALAVWPAQVPWR